MANQVPRSREAAQEQAAILESQAALGWGSDHEIAVLAKRLHSLIKAANLAESTAP